MVEKVRIEGLAEFLRELKKVDADLPKEIRLANKGFADNIASQAAGAFSSLGAGGPNVGATVKSFAQQRQAGIKFGGDLPYSMGVEFGARTLPQFAPWRGSGEGAGYALFPTIEANRDDLLERVGDAIDDVMRRAFPD